ncbi:MAG: hypothetical protein HZC16_03885 [Candidatus Omnitrophica bacterium]|nr:hypothetical protein [Candidatus Omnitrophota bacterium]
MVVYKIYLMFATPIFHVDNIYHINKSVKRKIQEKRLAIHPLFKSRGFLAKNL